MSKSNVIELSDPDLFTDSLTELIGVDVRGRKRFLAIEDGMRESTQSWREELLMLKARGTNAPKMAIGDGVMG